MDSQIISVAMIQAKARADYQRGFDRDEHGMNPGSPAIDTWQAAWDECDGKLRHVLGEGCRP